MDDEEEGDLRNGVELQETRRREKEEKKRKTKDSFNNIELLSLSLKRLGENDREERKGEG